MARRLMLAVASAAMVVAMIPGVVAAAAPVGGCPNGEAAGWYLKLPIHQPQPMDHNGDTWMCVKDLRNGSFTFRDNVVQP